MTPADHNQSSKRMEVKMEGDKDNCRRQMQDLGIRVVKGGVRALFPAKETESWSRDLGNEYTEMMPQHKLQRLHQTRSCMCDHRRSWMSRSVLLNRHGGRRQEERD
ncbi:hypothetical protein MAP00_007469 [Monascus purpureus]|nr:hypothetical protein MAP00_007469 [Monascus purpureus]